MMNRREEREQAFLLLFETAFDESREATEVYETAKEARDLEDSAYIHRVLSGVAEHKAELDEMIAAHSHGWNRERISATAAAAMLLAVYEMKYCEDIPVRVSLNEAIELMKKYDEDKARVFVNGVLNAIAKELEAKG